MNPNNISSSFHLNDIYNSIPINSDVSSYHVQNENHPNIFPNHLPSTQQYQHALNDEVKIYHNMLPVDANDRMYDVALDFSHSVQDVSENCKRKSTESLQHDKAAKIANVENVQLNNSLESASVTNDSFKEQKPKESNLILHIISKTQTGKLVLAAYEYDQKYKEKFKKFDIYAHKLANIVIDYEFMNNNFDIKRERFMFLRTEICDLFKGQVPEQWYSPSSAEVSAKGFLYNAYRKFRERCIELEVFQGTVRQSTSNVSDRSCVDYSNVLEESDIHNQVINKWVLNIDCRKKSYKNNSIIKLLDLYPCLTHDQGYKFILADFQHMYGDCSQNLLLKWPEICNNIINLVENEKNTSLIKKTFDEYNVLRIPKEVLTFLLLPLMLKASNQHVAKKGFTLTNQNLLDVFIYEAKEISDLENSDNFLITHQKIESIYSNIQEDSIKPYIVICGSFVSISATYLVLSKDCKYRTESLLIAVDIYMKLVLVVPKAVSKPLKQLCQFFHFYIFNADDKGIYKNVSNLVKKLRAE